MTDNFRELESADDEFQPREDTSHYSDDDSRSGMATIVTNATEGAYTITEVVYNSTTDAWIADTLGFTAQTARDYQNRDFGVAGDIVRYWTQENSVGEIEILIDLGGGGTCASPKTLYSTYEGSETAQTDTWDVTDQGENDGVKVYLNTRIVYNDSGDKILYGYYREFKYDSAGRLINISAETRYTVDAADDC
jgi:hypothetical protein